MSKMRSISSMLISAILFAFGGLIVGLSGRPIGLRSSPPFLIPPSNLGYFTLGYKELVGDLLWLRVIQDFDFCETRQIGERCSKGWVFRMIDATTQLSPDFRQPYYSGAIMLSIMVDDISGASEIFNRGVSRFPTDLNILYAAAYQALIEEKNNEKAANLLKRAGDAGAPAWVYSLTAKLQLKDGKLELAKRTLEMALDGEPVGIGVERIRRRLDEVNAEIAKQQSESAKPAQEQKH